MSRTYGWTALLALTLACGGDTKGRMTEVALTPAQDSARRDSVARARQDSINRATPGYVVDSIFPVEEMIRRFQVAVGGTPVTELQNASPSRDALIQRFMKAVVAGDSLELRKMVLNSREFIDLVYPESPNTKPPYTQDPALMWRTMQNPSGTGFTRLMRREGGVPSKLVSYNCAGRTEQQGKNRLVAGCLLKLADEKGKVSTHRFFGSIIERDGRFKFVSYRNEF